MLTGPKIPSTNSAWKKYQKRNTKVSPEVGRTYHNLLGQCTLKLCAFYTTCNSDFYYDTNCNPQRPLTEPSEGVENNGRDNKNFDLILHVSDTLGSNHPNQYKVVSLLGCGTFGQVVKTVNKRTKETVAIKVIKSQSAYFNQAKTEIAILKQLQDKYGKDERFRIVRLLDYFIQSDHLCLVFELLHNNLFELLRSNAYKGLSLNVIRVFLRQLLNALAILQECHIIHCDMKPENILVSDGSTASIKLIDFGSACYENQTVYTYIQSRYYRSPEVLCGYPYNSKIDVWSLGCILAELFLGLPLFPGVNDYNQMARICEMCGYPPQIVLEKGKNSLRYFRRVEDSCDLLANNINPNTNNPLTIPTVSPSDIPDSVPTQSLATRRNQLSESSISNMDNLEVNSKTPVKSQVSNVQSKANTSSPTPKDKKKKKPKEILGTESNTNKYDVDDSYLAEGSSAEETVDESLKKTCSLKELLTASELETTNSSNNISTESGSDMGTPNKPKNRNRYSSFDPPPPPTSFPVINNWQLRTEEDFCKITNSQPVVWKRYFNYTQLEDLIMHMPYNDQVDVEQEKISRAMFADFLRGLLIPDFRERWTAEQALEHPFVREDGAIYYKGPWKHHEYVQQEKKRIEEENRRAAEIAAALHHQAFSQHSRSVPIPRQPHIPMAYPASWSSLVSTSPGYTSSPSNTSSIVPTPAAANWARPMQSPPSPRSYFFQQAQARNTSQFPSSSLSSDASCSDADNVLDCGDGYIYGGFELCQMNNNYPNMGPKGAPWMAGPRSGGMSGVNRPPHQMIPGYIHSMAPGLAQDMLGISPSLMPHPAPWMPPHLQLSQNQLMNPNMAHVQQQQQQQQHHMKNNQKKHQKHSKGNRPSSWSGSVHVPPPQSGPPHVGSVPVGQLTSGPQLNQTSDTQNNNNNNNNNNNAFRRHKNRNKSGSGHKGDYGDTIFAMDIQ
eukprot:NODE_66_length_4042_cov_28.526665_g55_i0.p1 GENE.NODE_66_length_4042_cov_28.526665_g55_i0~~NODE_66_length_4042_cov_28.526665_g55_i0.p1  ORF type:complete len:952 (-),score=181.31 NODE_66_length_4042_cov_28.526665_g55_i0:1126-3981(-)